MKKTNKNEVSAMVVIPVEDTLKTKAENPAKESKIESAETTITESAVAENAKAADTKKADKADTKKADKSVDAKKKNSKLKVAEKKNSKAEEAKTEYSADEIFPKEFSVAGVKFTRLELFNPYVDGIVEAFDAFKFDENHKLVMAEYWNAELIQEYYKTCKKVSAKLIPAEFPQNLDLYAVDSILPRVQEINLRNLYNDSISFVTFKSFNKLAKDKNYFNVNDCETAFYIADFSEVENKEFIDLPVESNK